MLLVIPAIDLRAGCCVRLYQGSYEKEKVYFEDPVKMAKLWRVQNARVIHVVDLDAARGGEEHNRGVIRAICDELDIPIQVGGGIRTMDDIDRALEAGVYRVVIGTAAVRDPDLVSEAIDKYGCSRIVVGIDARGGEVRVEGWTEGSGVDAVEMALDMEERGCRRIVYTDISRDGTLEGPNTDAYRELGSRLSKVLQPPAASVIFATCSRLASSPHTVLTPSLSAARSTRTSFPASNSGAGMKRKVSIFRSIRLRCWTRTAGRIRPLPRTAGPARPHSSRFRNRVAAA